MGALEILFIIIIINGLLFISIFIYCSLCKRQWLLHCRIHCVYNYMQVPLIWYMSGYTTPLEHIGTCWFLILWLTDPKQDGCTGTRHAGSGLVYVSQCNPYQPRKVGVLDCMCNRVHLHIVFVFVLLYSVCRSVSVLSCVYVIRSFTYVLRVVI